jgi:hypothetical protein
MQFASPVARVFVTQNAFSFDMAKKHKTDKTNSTSVKFRPIDLGADSLA